MNTYFYPFFAVIFTLFLGNSCTSTQSSPHPTPPVPLSLEKEDFSIIAYYRGTADAIDKYPVEKLSHIIFSFLHLRGNKLVVDDRRDSLSIRKLVSLKKDHPKLKILLGVGGWDGCKRCSHVFASKKGRQEFAESVKQLTETYQTDGLDMDWEYPGLPGHPEQAYSTKDKQSFTSLMFSIRQVMGADFVLTFAAGGFEKFFTKSVEWDKVIPLVDFVNIMSYDMISGVSRQTGHHTPLFPTRDQKESISYNIQFLDSLGVPLSKLVIGAAFYGRMLEQVGGNRNGLYQRGKYKQTLSYRKFGAFYKKHPGFKRYWDDIAQAPYAYNPREKLFLTYDNKRSVQAKTRYAIEHELKGIMFWDLAHDVPKDGLLDAIYEEYLR